MADNPIHPESSDENNPPKIKLKPAEKKSDTARIDLASAKPPPSIVDKTLLPPDADDYFKRSTIRIDVPPAHGPGGTKSDTTKIEVNQATDAAKRQTAKIDLSAAAGTTDDVFKSKTIPVGIPAAPSTPQIGRPKTIQVKRPTAAPGESIIVSPESTANATEQARKSETARIDLSAEEIDRPATRPKTIRIKRPDGTSGRKALTISRPEGEVEQAAPVKTLESTGAESPGVFVGIMAIAALLITCVLVYVLLAQTLAPTLPFPGRII
jgi:hypothetical protein